MNREYPNTESLEHFTARNLYCAFCVLSCGICRDLTYESLNLSASLIVVLTRLKDPWMWDNQVCFEHTQTYYARCWSKVAFE